jgi:predicted  nucleic acid-binding Zn-ribbon protein
MTRSIDLYELQETDTAIDAAERRLTEIVAQLEDEGDLSGVDERIAELAGELSEAESQQTEADDAVGDHREKLRLLEEKLYSGEVKIPRELKALQEDVQAHQRQLTALEDTALSRLGSVEGLRSALAERRQDRTVRLEERELLVKSLGAEQIDINATLEQLRGRRQREEERVEHNDLVLYNRLRRARAGRAVAKVERGTCQGCRITLPTTVWQRARSGLKIVQCTSCERILYVV